MPKFDLAGNPLPEPDASAARRDLAGNPLPPATSALSPQPLTPTAPFPPPGGGYGPPGGAPPYAGRPATVAPAEGGSKKWIGLVAGGLAFVLAFVAVSLLIPKHADVPTSYTTFTAQDKSFTCASPVGWVTTGMDKSQTMAGQDSSVNGVLFQSNSAKIDITTDTLATLIAADLMKGTGDPQSITGDRAGVLHKHWKVQASATHKGYEETQVADFEGGMGGGGHLAEWTSDGNVFGLGGRLHGYRASLVGGDKTAEIVCQCLESDWPALKPVFLHVIKNINEGGSLAPDGPVSDAPTSDAPNPNAPVIYAPAPDPPAPDTSTSQ